MLNRISKTTKIAILGIGAVGFSGLAFYHLNKSSLSIQTKNKNHNSIDISVPQRINQSTTFGKAQGLIAQKKQQKHQHDSDIRVLDMVGFPAVDGSNILQEVKEPIANNNSHDKLDRQKQIDNNKQVNQSMASHNGQKLGITQNKTESNENKLIASRMPKKKEQSSQNQQKIIRKQQFKYGKIKQLPLFNIDQQISQEDYILILSDLEYNTAFQKQVVTKLSNIVRKRKSTKPLSIYRLNTMDPTISKKFKQKYGQSISQQTILLLKNPYGQQFINVDFKNYMQNENLPSIYLSQLKQISTKQELQKQLNKMTPNDTYLLYAINAENINDYNEKKAMGKYLQLELGNQRMQNIQVYLVDSNIAKQQGVLSKQDPSDSLNLIRKSNEFTYKIPNRWLFNLQPYHIIQRISLFDKQKNNIIPRYLSKVETFNSLKIDSPYICQVKIDRNKISPKQERQILSIFSQLKLNKQFPLVSYILKFGEVQYKGQSQQQFSNKKFSIKFANFDQIDKQSIMHQIKDNEDAKQLGITEKKWLRDTYEYIYLEPQATYQGISKFIRQSMKGNQNQFYKSEAKPKLQHVDKITAATFNQQILSKRNHSHLVFQYSDHCHACQLLAPIIEHMDDVCKKFPQIGLDVHVLNCDKNRIKEQPYSPYTPNLYLYSRNWVNKDPIRYHIVENVKFSNVWGIYYFCTITDQLKKINLQKFQEHIKNISQNKVSLTEF